MEVMPRGGAVYNNRARLLSGVARHAFRLRHAEWVERSFALILDVVACDAPGCTAART
jgi:hypothetical protein